MEQPALYTEARNVSSGAYIFLCRCPADPAQPRKFGQLERTVLIDGTSELVDAPQLAAMAAQSRRLPCQCKNDRQVFLHEEG